MTMTNMMMAVKEQVRAVEVEVHWEILSLDERSFWFHFTFREVFLYSKRT